MKFSREQRNKNFMTKNKATLSVSNIKIVFGQCLEINLKIKKNTKKIKIYLVKKIYIK
jgi:hypothetical protein